VLLESKFDGEVQLDDEILTSIVMVVVTLGDMTSNVTELYPRASKHPLKVRFKVVFGTLGLILRYPF
jgi:predicted membrane channel-forming protein YqfA (hemolysin III family)